MSRMIIMTGLQASGKSTFCREYFSGIVHISLDELKKRSRERAVIDECIRYHKDFVIDNTNLSAEERKRYFDIIKDTDYIAIGYYMRSVLAECLERNELREGKARIPRSAVAGSSKKLEIPRYSEGYSELYYVTMTEGGFVIHGWEGE